jgi:hypothetical protein
MRQTLTSSSRMMLRHMVGSMHVTATDQDVIRHIWHGLSPKGRSRAMRALRREAYKFALKTHKRNGRMYYEIMGGR